MDTTVDIPLMQAQLAADDRRYGGCESPRSAASPATAPATLRHHVDALPGSAVRRDGTVRMSVVQPLPIVDFA